MAYRPTYSSTGHGYSDPYRQPPSNPYGTDPYRQQPPNPDPYRQQPPASQYGGYPPPGGAYPPQQGCVTNMFPPNTDRAIIDIFQQADHDRSGTIDANELGRLLSEGRVAFSPRTIRLMLHLFADNPADTTRIGPIGFVKLWKELGVWHAKFLQYDRDRSGTIDVTELQQALLSFYFAIPPQVLDMLVRKYDRSGFNKCIGYGEFVECGFVVKGLTEKFRDQDRLRIGSATLDYTSFMLLVIPFIAA